MVTGRMDAARVRVREIPLGPEQRAKVSAHRHRARPGGAALPNHLPARAATEEIRRREANRNLRLARTRLGVLPTRKETRRAWRAARRERTAQRVVGTRGGVARPRGVARAAG